MVLPVKLERGFNMADSGVVPGPESSLSLVLRGGQQLGQGIGQQLQDNSLAAEKKALLQKQEQEAARPVHPLMQQYIQRIFNGEDPVRVGNEARNDPGFADFITQVTQGAGRPGGSRNQFDPGPSMQQPAPQQAPGQSLGGAPTAAPPSMGQAPGPAPQAGPSLGSMGGGQQQPAMAPRPQAPQVPITARDLQQMQGVLPTAAAAQGRQQTAQMQADLKRELLGQNLAFQMEKLDANTRMEVMKLLSGEKKVGMQTETQREVANTRAAATRDAAATAASSRRDVANTSAAARTSAAAARGAGKNPAEMERKELNAELQSQLKTIERLNAVSEFDKQPGIADEIKAAKARVQELRTALGRAPGAVPAAAPPTRSTFPQAPTQQAAPSAPAQVGGKIRVRLKDGRTGKIDAKDFNPATMERL